MQPRTFTTVRENDPRTRPRHFVEETGTVQLLYRHGIARYAPVSAMKAVVTLNWTDVKSSMRTSVWYGWSR